MGDFRLKLVDKVLFKDLTLVQVIPASSAGIGQGAAGSLYEVTATGKQWEKHEVLGLISTCGMQYSFTAPQTSLLSELDVREEFLQLPA